MIEVNMVIYLSECCNDPKEEVYFVEGERMMQCCCLATANKDSVWISYLRCRSLSSALQDLSCARRKAST